LNIFKFSSLKYTNYGWRFKKKKLKDILNIYKNDFNLYFFLKGFFFMLKKSKKNFSFFKTFFFFYFFYKKKLKKNIFKLCIKKNFIKKNFFFFRLFLNCFCINYFLFVL